MKSILLALLTGVLLFAASLVGSYLFLVEEPVVDETTEVVSAESGTDDILDSPIKDESRVEAMPVAMRPEMPVTVEAVAELAQSIMEKEKALIRSEKGLQKEEKRIALLYEDLKRERTELESFGEKIDAKVRQAKEALETLKMETATLAKQSRELSSLEKKTGVKSEDIATDEIARRVDVVKNWFKNLDPEQAANYLKEFANRGDLEFSARLLDSLGERQIAKILAAFNDAPLVAQIVDAYTKRKNADGEGERAIR